MDFIVDALNELDEKGFYRQAQILEQYAFRYAGNKENKALIASLVAAIILGKFFYHNNKTAPPVTPKPLKNEAVPKKVIKSTPALHADIKSFFKFIKGGVEGDYSNDKADSGGVTIQGTSQQSWDDIREKYDFLPENVEDSTEEQRDKYTKLFYWDHLKADKLPFAVGMQLVDFRFNGGQVVSHVIHNLQKELGIETTNEINPETIKAIWEFTGNDLHKQLQLARYIARARNAYYHSDLISEEKKQEFGKGWHNRLIALDRFIVHRLFPNASYVQIKKKKH
jgi:lysozyme family protein